ncbi:superinfection exclusion B family protein [Rosenbergiella metrosideri]|uniref:superinfection exclusion B family protein n=1 Tax=Rosenbergiella metrosideri TaxID=2921185 RepID=UPI001F4F1E3C|nr:superinfection exclusion B family protein [Rosenbergiella metrosideri]
MSWLISLVLLLVFTPTSIVDVINQRSTHLIPIGDYFFGLSLGVSFFISLSYQWLAMMAKESILKAKDKRTLESKLLVLSDISEEETTTLATLAMLGLTRKTKAHKGNINSITSLVDKGIMESTGEGLFLGAVDEYVITSDYIEPVKKYFLSSEELKKKYLGY